MEPEPEPEPEQEPEPEPEPEQEQEPEEEEDEEPYQEPEQDWEEGEELNGNGNPEYQSQQVWLPSIKSLVLLTQQPRVRIPAFPKKIQMKNYRWRGLEKSGQWFENVDRTHLVLDSS